MKNYASKLTTQPTSPIAWDTEPKRKAAPRPPTYTSKPKMGLWKQFLENTDDNKPVRSPANYHATRTQEQFVTGRTLNPQQYSSLADLMTVKS